MIAERLLDVRDGHLVVDGDVDVMRGHGQRRQRLVGRNQTRRRLDAAGAEKHQAKTAKSFRMNHLIF